MAVGRVFADPVLHCIAGRRGKSVAQIVLRWLIQQYGDRGFVSHDQPVTDSRQLRRIRLQALASTKWPRSTISLPTTAGLSAQPRSGLGSDSGVRRLSPLLTNRLNQKATIMSDSRRRRHAGLAEPLDARCRIRSPVASVVISVGLRSARTVVLTADAVLRAMSHTTARRGRILSLGANSESRMKPPGHSKITSPGVPR
jgi:hypothetical protein